MQIKQRSSAALCAFLTSALLLPVCVRWRTSLGWAEIGWPGVERLPPPALRWTWTSSRSTCRSTRWKSSLHALRPRPRTPWGTKRTYIPIRAQGSQVSLQVVAAVMMVAAYLHMFLYDWLRPVCVCLQWIAGRDSIRTSGTVALIRQVRNMKIKLSLLPGLVSIPTSGWVQQCMMQLSLWWIQVPRAFSQFIDL